MKPGKGEPNRCFKCGKSYSWDELSPYVLSARGLEDLEVLVCAKCVELSQMHVTSYPQSKATS